MGILNADGLPAAVLPQLGGLRRLEAGGVSAHHDEAAPRGEHLVCDAWRCHVGNLFIPERRLDALLVCGAGDTMLPESRYVGKSDFHRRLVGMLCPCHHWHRYECQLEE